MPNDILEAQKNKMSQALASLNPSVLLRVLSPMAPLPVEGLLAGQALASAIMAELGVSSRGPYNDVDVFMSSASPRGAKLVELDEWVAPRRLSSLGSHITDAGAYRDSYSAITRSTIKQGYKICVVGRRGMLNEIVFERFANRSLSGIGVSDALVLIRGFDLNCTQVALDLSSRKLTWTPAFTEFLVTSSLRIESSSTPMHSATRYFRKKKELDCLGDDELNMGICAVRCLNGDFDPVPTTLRRMQSQEGRYGRKTHDEFLASEDLIAPWFKQVEVEGTQGLWTMSPNLNAPGGAILSVKQALSGEGEHSGAAWATHSLGSLLQCHATEFARQVLRPADEDVARRKVAASRFDSAFVQASPRGDVAKALCVAVGLASASSWSDAEDGDYSSVGELLSAQPDYFDTVCSHPVREQGEICAKILKARAKHGIVVDSALIGMDYSQNFERLAGLLSDDAAMDAFGHREAFEAAIRGGDVVAFQKNLPFVDLDTKSPESVRLAHRAICSGKAQIVQGMLGIIGGVSEWPQDCAHPLVSACAHAGADVVSLLLPLFPEQDVVGLSACGRDGVWRQSGAMTLLMHAACYGRPDIVELLLPLGGGSQKNECGFDALEYAVARGSAECFDLLLPHCDVHQIDHEGRSLLHRAAQCRFIGRGDGSVRNLVYLASVLDPLAQEPNFGFTPLAIAVRVGNLAAVEALLPVSDLAAVDLEGRTALGIAQERLAGNGSNSMLAEIAGLIERYKRAMDERLDIAQGAEPSAAPRGRRAGL